MSKELDLEQLELELEYAEEQCDTNLPYFREAIKALTPPTEEELCKELSAVLNEFPEKEKVYYREETKLLYTFWDGEFVTIAKLETNNEVQIFKPFPPRLIKRIAMFFEKENRRHI